MTLDQKITLWRDQIAKLKTVEAEILKMQLNGQPLSIEMRVALTTTLFQGNLAWGMTWAGESCPEELQKEFFGVVERLLALY